MWTLVPRSIQISIVVAITLFTSFTIQGVYKWWLKPEPSLYRQISTIGFILGTVVVVAFNWGWRWVWQRLPFLNRVFFPDLNGVWTGTLQTTWVDPSTGKSPRPIKTKITISQSLFDINVKQRTNESDSYSTWVIPTADTKADRYRLWFSYTNTPKQAFQYRSAVHEGVCWLEINLTDNADTLLGQYFSARKTTGDISVTRLLQELDNYDGD